MSILGNTKIQILILASFTLRLLYSILANPGTTEISFLYNHPYGDENSFNTIYTLLNFIGLDNTYLQLRLPLLIIFSISLYLFYKIVLTMFNAKTAYSATLILHTFPIIFYTGCIASSHCLFLFFALLIWFFVKKYDHSKFFHCDFICGLFFLPAFINDSFAFFLIIPTMLTIYLGNSDAKEKVMRIFSLTIGFAISLTLAYTFGFAIDFSHHLFHNFQSVNPHNFIIKILYQVSPWMIFLSTFCIIIMVFSFLQRNHDPKRNQLIEVFSWSTIFSCLLFIKMNSETQVTASLLIILPCIAILIAYCIHYQSNYFSKSVFSLTVIAVIFSIGFYFVSWSSVRHGVLPSKLTQMNHSQVQKEILRQANDFIQENSGIKSFANTLKEGLQDTQFIFTDDTDLSLLLSFYLGRQVYGFYVNNSTLTHNGKFLSQDGLYITENSIKGLKYGLSMYFKKVRFVKEISITKSDKVFKRFFIYKCSHLKFPFNYELKPQS